MKLDFRNLFFVFFLQILLINVFVISCSKSSLHTIRTKKMLRVITDNNANCYYLYKNQPMGMEYELAKGFAEFLEVELEILTPDWQDMYKILNKKKAEIIAANLTLTGKRQEELGFSEGIIPIQQYIIIHKNNNSIKYEKDLEGHVIHVRKNTSYHERLTKLQESGLNFSIQLYDDLSSEEFIKRVSNKEIGITVSDSHIARLNRRYYPNIKLAFPIEKEQWLGWAVKKDETELLKKINEYFSLIKENGTFDLLYNKYYENSEIFDYVDLVAFHKRIETRLPKYIDIIKQESARYGFDWRLIAAMIYQESHFNPRAKSYTGVRGLMQLTLTTAKELGINNRLNPEQSIKGGIKYLNKLYSRFSDIKGQDRLNFAMASYNIGYGHIKDAQILAKNQGLDANNWKSLMQVLPQLSQRKYYKTTKHGYARGTEPVRYVSQIQSYYEILRRQGIK